jgi:hypothetical protein
MWLKEVYIMLAAACYRLSTSVGLVFFTRLKPSQTWQLSRPLCKQYPANARLCCGSSRGHASLASSSDAPLFHLCHLNQALIS